MKEDTTYDLNVMINEMHNLLDEIDKRNVIGDKEDCDVLPDLVEDNRGNNAEIYKALSVKLGDLQIHADDIAKIFSDLNEEGIDVALKKGPVETPFTGIITDFERHVTLPDWLDYLVKKKELEKLEAVQHADLVACVSNVMQKLAEYPVLERFRDLNGADEDWDDVPDLVPGFVDNNGNFWNRDAPVEHNTGPIEKKYSTLWHKEATNDGKPPVLNLFNMTPVEETVEEEEDIYKDMPELVSDEEETNYAQVKLKTICLHYIHKAAELMLKLEVNDKEEKQIVIDMKEEDLLVMECFCDYWRKKGFSCKPIFIGLGVNTPSRVQLKWSSTSLNK